MTSLPIFFSQAHCSTTAPMRERHGYPLGLETMDVPALTTIRVAAERAAKQRMYKTGNDRDTETRYRHSSGRSTRQVYR